MIPRITQFWEYKYVFLELIREIGGIGRRGSLKNCFWKQSIGSTPISPTKKKDLTILEKDI